MNNKRHRLNVKIAVFATIIIGLSGLSYYFFDFAQAKALIAEANGLAASYPILFGSIIFAMHTVGMAFSLPTKGILTVLTGAFLGAFWGSILTLAGCYLGTSVLFFLARGMFRQHFAQKAPAWARGLSKRIEEKPIRLMAGLRLNLTLPFGPCTIAASLTNMSYPRFLVGSLIGDLPIVVTYSIAGTGLVTMASLDDAISPTMALALAAVGLILVVPVFLRPRILGRR